MAPRGVMTEPPPMTPDSETPTLKALLAYAVARVDLDSVGGSLDMDEAFQVAQGIIDYYHEGQIRTTTGRPQGSRLVVTIVDPGMGLYDAPAPRPCGCTCCSGLMLLANLEMFCTGGCGCVLRADNDPRPMPSNTAAPRA